MKKISFIQPDGVEISLYQATDGKWCCPVCGSAELMDQPYYAEGGASFEMCNVCKFEFGFDDSPLAGGALMASIQQSWIYWRWRILKEAKFNKEKRNILVEQLKNIEISAE